jgi:putative membrane protein
MKHDWLVAMCLTCAAATGAWAAESKEPTSAEGLFVQQASQGSLAEVELAKLAQARSSTPSVKAFAAMALKDYGALRQQLEPLAKRKNLDFPTSLDDEHARIVHAASTKPPSEFDAEFSKQVTDIHSRLLTTFADAAATSDKELAAFARTTASKLKQQEKSLATLPRKVPADADRARTIGIGPGASRAIDPAPASSQTGAAQGGDVARTPNDPSAAGTVAADAAAEQEGAIAAEAAKHPPADAAHPHTP